MHRWLLDLRRAIGNTSAPSLLEETKRIAVFSSGASGAVECAAGTGQPGLPALASRLKGELGASLVRHRAPFRLTQQDGRAQRIESSTMMVRKWLFSGAHAGHAGQAVLLCVAHCSDCRLPSPAADCVLPPTPHASTLCRRV